MDLTDVCLIITGILIVIDIACGFIAGLMEKKIDSSVMRDGLVHKGIYLFVIGMAMALEWAGGYIEEIDIPVLIPTLLYISCIELSSILENVVSIAPELKDVPVFSVLNRVDSHINNKEEDHDDNERN